MQRAAGDVLHDEEMQIFFLSDSMHTHDVRVREVGLCHRLLVEALDHPVAHHDCRRHDLERNLAIERILVREVNGGHTTATQFHEDFVLSHGQLFQATDDRIPGERSRDLRYALRRPERAPVPCDRRTAVDAGIVPWTQGATAARTSQLGSGG